MVRSGRNSWVTLRIALFGPFMFEFAAGLRDETGHEVHLFLDAATLPRSLAHEPLIRDPTFATIGRFKGTIAARTLILSNVKFSMRSSTI